MIDIYISGSTGSLGKHILPNLIKNNFNVFPINLRKPLINNIIPTIENNSYFIHLASQNSNMKFADIDNEVSILKSAIEIALKKNIKHFIFFSTSKLYPYSSNQKLVHEESQVQAFEPYTMGKLRCEELLKESSKLFNSVSIFRLAPVLVRSTSSNLNLLFKFCEIMPIIPIFPSGNNNLRSFLSVSNLINFLIAHISAKKSGINIINICDNSPISTNKLIISFLRRNRPRAIKITIPEKFELVFFNLPFFGKKLQLLFQDNLLCNVKMKRNYPMLDLNETHELMDIT